MAFFPEAFYSVADELRLKAQADGGHLRTLISRAYYGALLVARDAKSLTTKGENGHQAVIQAYQKGDGVNDSIVADHLIKLKKLRVQADYQPEINLKAQDGVTALASSKRVLYILKALPGSRTQRH